MTYRPHHCERPSNLTETIAAAVLRGMSPQDVAAVYGVSVRTAYRYRAQLVSLSKVTIDGWTATFARRRGKPPMRVTAWLR